MAYLKKLTVKCNYMGCKKSATVELFSTENYSIGSYCKVHGNVQLKIHNTEEIED